MADLNTNCDNKREAVAAAGEEGVLHAISPADIIVMIRYDPTVAEEESHNSTPDDPSHPKGTVPEKVRKWFMVPECTQTTFKADYQGIRGIELDMIVNFFDQGHPLEKLRVGTYNLNPYQTGFDIVLSYATEYGTVLEERFEDAEVIEESAGVATDSEASLERKIRFCAKKHIPPEEIEGFRNYAQLARIGDHTERIWDCPFCESDCHQFNFPRPLPISEDLTFPERGETGSCNRMDVGRLVICDSCGLLEYDEVRESVAHD